MSTLIGGYRVQRWLARGGSADVYAVSHPLLDVPLALKLATRADSKHAHARFAREMQILGQLEHPAFVRAYDLGQSDEGRDWLVLDRVDGLALKDWAGAIGHVGTARRNLQVARLGARVADALAHLHGLGLVHGDIKPGNMRVQLGGEPRIFDMGAALDLHAPTSWTRFGAGLGTGCYAAPEVVARDFDQVGLRADVYALGVTLYELFTGKNPFRGGSDEETHVRQRELVVPRLDRALPGFDARVADLIDTMLAKRVADRAETMRSIGEALRRYAGPEVRMPPVPTDLAPFVQPIGVARGFLRDAPAGRALLVDGPRCAGVDAVLARLCDDAVQLGWEVVALARVGVDGVVARARGPLEQPTLVLIERLDGLSAEQREVIEAALIAASERDVPIGLLCGRESDALPPGPVNVYKRAGCVRATLAVKAEDYVRRAQSEGAGLLRARAYGERWLEGIGLRAQAGVEDDDARRVLGLLRACAWPLPRAVLATLGLAPARVTLIIDALMRGGLVRAHDGRVAAVGATSPTILGIPIDWDAGLALIDEPEARVAWLVAAGRVVEASAALAALACDELTLEVLGATLPSDGEHGQAIARRRAEQLARWQPPALVASPTFLRVDRLRRDGRLSEARALAERTLATSERGERIMMALALARIAEDLGAYALMDRWRERARDDAAAIALSLDGAPRLGSGVCEALAAALERDDPDARRLLEQVVSRLDPHDRQLLLIRPDVVRLRASESQIPVSA